MLGLASATVQKYAREGRIPFDLTPGGHRRFHLEEVRAALSPMGASVVQEDTVTEDVRARFRATAVILTALGLEYDAVRARLESWKEVRSTGGTRFEVGDFRGAYVDWHVCVAEIGEGNTDAAIETDRAISEFDPDLVLFVGVAGGFKDDIRHGDVVVASKVYDYHGGKAANEFYPRPVSFLTLHDLDQLVRKVRRERWLTSAAGETLDQPDVQLKPIAAGQAVVTSKRSEIAQIIRRHYNDTVAVDMESAGMYRAAQRASLPALAVRGISDLLDDKTSEADADRQPRAARHATAFAFALLGAVEPEVLKLGPAVPVSAPTSDVAETGELLGRVPPIVVAEYERARADSVEDANALLRRLANETVPPADLVARLVAEQPGWLARSNSSHLWTAIGEFAAAHEARAVTIDAFVRAADIGGPELPKLMARAALAAAGDDQLDKARQLLQRARELAGGVHLFVEVVEAAVEAAAGGDTAAVLEATEAHGEGDPLVEMMRGRALTAMGRREDALAVHEAALESYPANAAAALEVTQLLLARYVTDESESPVTDLERARELALQARELRRGWRGNSAEAAAVAAKAASFSGDLDAVLKVALPPPEGEASEAEAKNAEVLVQASHAALRVGNTQRALELAERISDPLERDLAQAECFRSIPGSDDLARDAYKRALAAAPSGAKPVRAYFGLARLGEWPIAGLEDVRSKDPEVFDMVAAEADLARGDIDGAIKRYRKRKRSPRVLDELVGVYLEHNRVDEAVAALRDGAERHRNPELRVRAAHALISARRYEDAEAEAKRAMDAVPAGSRQHQELRKLRVQLAAWLVQFG